MVQILLMLTILFTQNAEVKYLFSGFSPGSEASHNADTGDSLVLAEM